MINESSNRKIVPFGELFDGLEPSNTWIISPLVLTDNQLLAVYLWWVHMDLNHGPTPYQDGALPTELCTQKHQQNLQTERSNFGIREDLGYYNLTVLFSPIEVKIDNVLLAG